MDRRIRTEDWTHTQGDSDWRRLIARGLRQRRTQSARQRRESASEDAAAWLEAAQIANQLEQSWEEF